MQDEGQVLERTEDSFPGDGAAVPGVLYLPAELIAPAPAVIVIHEILGLTPHIQIV